jgi:hypothetical protein
VQTIAAPVQTIATPVQTIATPVQTIATPVQTIATPVQDVFHGTKRDVTRFRNDVFSSCATHKVRIETRGLRPVV